MMRPEPREQELVSTTLYQLVGGSETFFRLADRFYEAVRLDERLKAMFPEDLTGPKERLALFLIQYFGGPSTYSELRGHPRLRMRHVPFRIGKDERDRWVRHMLAAVDAEGIAEPMRAQMVEYFERTATFMINASSDAGDDDTGRSASG
jgi:hemoglobin